MARQIGPLRAWGECAGLALPWALLRALPLERAIGVGAAMGTLVMSLDRFNRVIADRNPIIDAAVTARRVRFGNLSVPRKGAGREIMRLLHDNWMVAVPLDLDTRHGVFVDFFGMPAATNIALARLAIATGAPILPVFMVREDGSARHRITILPVTEPAITAGDRAESV